MMLRRSGSRAEPAADAPRSDRSDSDHVRKVYEEHVRVIYRFIYARVGNREEAEDLTSQVFMKAMHGLDATRDAESAQSWLFQVARTTVADHWRRFYRLRTDSLDDLMAAGWEVNEEPPPPEKPPDDLAHKLLSRLPERYREVLTHRFLHNQSIRETAELMHLTEANVKVLQFRALKKAAELDAEQ